MGIWTPGPGPTDGDDTFTGDATNETASGGLGNDTLYGGGGNDVLEGGVGDDVLNGGDGSDVASYVSASAAINATLAISGPQDTTGAGWDSIAGIESITGSAWNDTLSGDGLRNTLRGGDGDDTLRGGDGNDILFGELGTDLLIGDGGNDTIVSDADGDAIDGGDGQDLLDLLYLDTPAEGFTLDLRLMDTQTGVTLSNGTTFRNVERIYLETGTQSVTLIADAMAGRSRATGGGAADRAVLDLSAATGGVSTRWYEATEVTVRGPGFDFDLLGYESFEITGSSAADGLQGWDNNDILRGGLGNDGLEGGYGDDVLYGEGGDDSLSDRDGYSGILPGNDVLDGGEGNDTLGGSGGRNSLNGGDGDDIISSGGTFITSVDQIDGGSGNDQLRLDRRHLTAGQSLLWEEYATDAGSALSDGTTIRNIETLSASLGSGDDTLSFRGTPTTTISFDGGSGVDLFILDFSGAAAPVVMQNGYIQVGDTSIYTSSVEQMELSAGSGDDRLAGNSGDDILDGGGGNDVIAVGPGSDTLRGGDGEDIIRGDHATSVGLINIDGGDGHDYVELWLNALTLSLTVYAGGAPAAGPGIIQNVEKMVIYGDFASETFRFFGAPVDLVVLDAASGVDTFIGDFSSVATPVILAGNLLTAGSGTIDLRGFEVLNIRGGSGDDDIQGSYLDDTLSGGGSGPDVIDGGAGNDRLEGGGARDVLTGGAGADTLLGGEGDDSLYFDVDDLTGGQVHGGAGLDWILNTTTDLNVVVPTINMALLEAEAYNGNGAAETIDASGVTSWTVLYGNGGNDTLIGGSATDFMYGGDGDDVMTGNGGPDVFNGGAGNDTVTYASAATAAIVDLSGSTANSGAAFGDSFTGIEVVVGSAYGDRLTGGAGNDRLEGGGARDILTGGAGSDTLLGGEGDDSLYFDVDDLTGGQVRGGAGLDWIANTTTDLNVVVPTINMALLEAEAYNGNGAAETIDASGVTSWTVLYGNGGNDTFLGGSGVDFMYGGDGDDTMTGNGGADVFNGGAGNDTVTYASAATAAVVDLSGSTANSGTAVGDSFTSIEVVVGSAYGDRLTGGTGNDRLEGGGARDILTGGAGADTLLGGEGDDSLYFDVDDLTGGQVRGGAGLDWILNATTDLNVVVPTINMALLEAEAYNGNGAAETIDASGVTSWTVLYGNGGNDTLIGGSGTDFMYGGDGDDVMTGNGGADVFNGGAGNDTVNGGDGSDTIVFSGLRSEYAFSQDATTGAWTITDTVAGRDGSDLAGATVELARFADQTIDLTTLVIFNEISGTPGADILNGAAGADRISGLASTDAINGGGGDDELIGGGGDDWITGGEGVDTVVFTGNSADYVMVEDAATNRWTIVDMTSGRDGGDVIEYDVEYARFADQTLDLTAGPPPSSSALPPADTPEFATGFTGADMFLI